MKRFALFGLIGMICMTSIAFGRNGPLTSMVFGRDLSTGHMFSMNTVNVTNDIRLGSRLDFDTGRVSIVQDTNPATWSISGLYDFKTHQTTPVVLAPPMRTIALTDLFGRKGLNVKFNIDPMIGATSRGKGTIGIAGVLPPFKFAKEGSIVVGLFERIESGAPPIGGVVGGVTYLFGT